MKRQPHWLLESLPYAFAYVQMITDNEGTPRDSLFLHTNRAFNTMIGLHRDQIIGKRASEIPLINREIHSQWLKAYTQVTLKGESLSFEQYLEPFTTWYQIEIYSEEPGYFAMVFGASKKHREEIERVSHQDSLADPIDGTCVGTWKWNVQTNEYHYSKEWAKIIGYTEEELSPLSKKTRDSFIHPLDEESVKYRQKRHLSGETDTYHHRYRMRHRDGHWVWVLDKGRVTTYTEEDKPLWMSGTLLTDSLCKEKGLDLMKMRCFHPILNSIGDGVMITDGRKSVLYMNPVAERLTGWSMERAEGREIIEIFPIVHSITLKPIEHPIDYLLKTSEDRANLTRRPLLIDRHGAKIHISYQATPILHSDKKIIGVVLVFREITREYRIQRALQESEAQKKAILDGISINIALVDKDLQFLWINKSTARSAGKKIEEMIGETCHSFFGDPEKPCKNCPTVKAFHSKKSEHTMMYNPDGRIWNERGEPIFDEEGNVVAVITIAEDITTRIKMEESLKKSERNYREIFHSINDALFIHDTMTGEIVDANESAVRMYGCNSKWEIIHHFDEFSNTAAGYHHKRAKELMEEALTSKTKTFEWHAKKKNQETFWVEVSLKEAIIDGRERVLAVVRDISSRKSSEEALRESETRFLVIAESAPVGIVISDHEERILYINQKFVHLFGYTEDDIPSVREWWPLAYPDKTIRNHVKERWNLAVQEAMKTHSEITPMEFPVTCKDGRVKEIEFRLASTDSINIVIFLDITQRKKTEDQLKENIKKIEELYYRLNHEIKKAQQVHRHILPQTMPSIEGLSFSSHYYPAEKIGGDFYDIVKIGSRLIIYLSDVSGHGLHSAMLSIFIKHTIKGYLSFTPPEELTPIKILQYLNTQFNKENYPERLFICIFLAILDLESLEMTYTGAGFQDTPLLREGHGEKRRLLSKGFFISNVFSASTNTWQENKVTLTPGSTILFHTDGLTEQMQQGVLYRDRLPGIFYENTHLPPDLIVKTIVEDFCHFNNGSLQGNDDITLLVLQIDPENEKHRIELATDVIPMIHLQEKIFHFIPPLKNRNTILTCLYELISNAMEHGNRMDPEKSIYLECMVSDEYIMCSIEDEGEGFNWNDTLEQSFEREGHTKRGRGIALTKILSDTLFYNQEGNKVTCIIKTHKEKP